MAWYLKEAAEDLPVWECGMEEGSNEGKWNFSFICHFRKSVDNK